MLNLNRCSHLYKRKRAVVATIVLTVLKVMYAWVGTSADPEEMGGRGSGTPLLENHKAIGFLSNTDQYWSISPENHKATSQHSMLGHHWADDCPLSAVFESSLPSSTKNVAKVGPPLTKLSEIRHDYVL